MPVQQTTQYAQPARQMIALPQQQQQIHHQTLQQQCHQVQVQHTNGGLQHQQQNTAVGVTVGPAPPIPDPDYSFSESDGEDENSILVARNTKLNEKIALMDVPETSGNSNTR